MIFEDLGRWESTRDVLHNTLRVLAAVPRRFAPQHERWWHIGVRARKGGLWLNPVFLPDGGSLELGVRTADHAVVIETAAGHLKAWPLRDGPSPAELALGLFSEVNRLGLTGLDPGVFSSVPDGPYDPDEANRYYDLIGAIDRIFAHHRKRLPGETSPTHLWPHGFDVSFEWFGTRRIELTGDGAGRMAPAQLNLGWSPGEESHPAPYFYSNPWPFDDSLKEHSLPKGAAWMDGAWKGSILPYGELVGDPAGEERLLDYAWTVFRLAAPTLTE